MQNTSMIENEDDLFCCLGSIVQSYILEYVLETIISSLFHKCNFSFFFFSFFGSGQPGLLKTSSKFN